jgi:hypothetical protein
MTNFRIGVYDIHITLRVFENRVLRRIFERRRDEVMGKWRKNYIMRNLMICTPH